MTIPVLPASMLSGSDPREGSRDTGEGIIVSESPDVCLTPVGGEMVPLPYQIWARQQDVAEMADTVRQTDMRTHVRGSLVLRCYGDEPGTGGGVISGTTGAECTPKTWSETVRAQGRNVVRHDDQWWMNHRNTYGRLYYTKDMSEAPVAQPCAVTPLLRAVASTTTDVPSAAPLITAPTSNLPAVTSGGVPASGVPGSGGVPSLGPGDYIEQHHPPVDGTNVNQPLEDFQEKERRRRLQELQNALHDGAVLGGGGNNSNRTSGATKIKCWDITKFLSKRPNSRARLIKEYCKQIRVQEAAINNLSPKQYQDGRTYFKKNGRVNDQGAFRDEKIDERTQFYQDEKHMSYNDASAQANLDFQGQVGLHDPDQVVGGNNSALNEMGDARVNSSIGGGWPGGRVGEVDASAETAKADGAAKMNVKLCVTANGRTLC